MKRHSALTVIFLSLIWIAALIGPKLCSAQVLTTLASFNGNVGGGTLVQAPDGNFYGTTLGGTYMAGTVFKMTPTGTLTTLYNFGATSDGAAGPNGLTLGADGNFYGVTMGYLGSCGTFFKITTAGALTTLHVFNTPLVGIPPEGCTPEGGVVQGSDGNFYGTTDSGGPNQGGTVFRMTPGGVLTIVYSFSPTDTGAYGLTTNLIEGTDGSFYGTTIGGGTYGAGSIFKVTAAGVLTTIYNFGTTAIPYTYANPSLALQGSDGNFYGSSNPFTGGGAQPFTSTIFKITPGGALTTLFTFSTTNLSQGIAVQASDGSFYGATSTTYTGGTIFKITSGGAFTTVYSFSSFTEGYTPRGLIQGSDGNLYGTTSQGGAYGWGTVFRLLLPGTSTYTCTNTTPPVITSVDSASAYGGYNYFASGTWLEIKGSNLADPNDPRLSATTNPGQWTSADFNGSSAPTSLDGISVSINGKPAYVWYLSTGQLNVQAPEDTATGNVAITVTNCKATSPLFTFARRALAPGFLAPTNYSANGEQYIVATFQSDGAYVLNTATGATFGLKSRPAKPGDGIIAYGIGFGDVTPSILPGVIVGASNTLVNPVTISFGTTKAAIAYQGLAGGFVGLYEFYFTVPSTLANGDYQIEVTQNGTTMPQTMYLTVHN